MKRPRVVQVSRLAAFGEPGEQLRQQRARFTTLPLVAPQSTQARRGSGARENAVFADPATNLKALAEYVGTSVAMIENTTDRFISDRGLAPLMPADAGPEPETANLAGTFASKR